MGGWGRFLAPPGPGTHLAHAGLPASGRSSGRGGIKSGEIARLYEAIVGGEPLYTEKSSRGSVDVGLGLTPLSDSMRTTGMWLKADKTYADGWNAYCGHIG